MSRSARSSNHPGEGDSVSFDDADFGGSVAEER